jgi:radical SAM protein with 4Fe4S-binding SPASM domain
MDVVHTIRRLNQEYDLKVEEPSCTYKCALTDPDDEWHILIKSNGSFQPCQSLYREDFSLGSIDCLDAQALMFRAQHIAQIAREREKTDFMCHNCLLGPMSRFSAE